MVDTLPGRPVPATTPRASFSRAGSGPTSRPVTGMLFVAPTAVLVLVFFLMPLAVMLFMSFSDWPLLGSHHLDGLANYREVAHDSLFLHAITFTLIYTAITTVMIFGISFLLVAVSNSPRRGAVAYRTAFFLPYVVGTASAALLWFADTNDQVGVFNRLLLDLHIVSQPVGFLDTPTKALLTVVSLVIWKFIGFQVMVLLVGLRAIPDAVHEAARIDGAGTWQRLRYITLPYLKPTLALLLMLSISGSLLAFDQFYVLTSGGPNNSTITMVLALYNTAFSQFKLGTAAAMSVILLISLVVLNAIQLRLLRSKDA